MTAEFDDFPRNASLVPEDSGMIDPDSALGILTHFIDYVYTDPAIEAVSWQQLFDDPEPKRYSVDGYRVERPTSFKSIRSIEIDDKHKLHVEAIVLEEEAQRPASRNDPDQHPSMWFRLTLADPSYEYNPRRDMDPDKVFCRIYIDLGEEGALSIDTGAGRKSYEREYYEREYQPRVAGLDQHVKKHPVLSLFLAQDTSPVRGRLIQHSLLTVDHMRALKTVFPPHPAAPVPQA